MSDTATATATVEVPKVDPKAAQQANAVIGAIGVWSEWVTTNGDAYFVNLMEAASTAVTTITPSISGAYKVFAAEHPTWERDRFTPEAWITAVGQARGEAWEPDAIDRARLTIPFTLAHYGHSAAAMGHYLKVCTADLTGTYGVRDIDGYLAWLPKRAEYQEVNDKGRTIDLATRSDAAIAADAIKLAANQAKAARKAQHNLTGYVFDTIADPNAFATRKDYVKRLVALEHDFAAFVAAQVEALGDEGKAAKREIAKQITDATKVKATPRASK